MSEPNRGGSLFIYHDDYRFGLTDSEVGPGALDIVYQEYEKGKGWVTRSSISTVPVEDIQALATAAGMLNSWEGEKPRPTEVVIKIEPR